MLNSDYKDILYGLSEEKVKFILVGAYVLAAHGYPRSTRDIDLWIKPERNNAEAIMRALLRFGAPDDTISSAEPKILPARKCSKKKIDIVHPAPHACEEPMENSCFLLTMPINVCNI
jgi:hypothetical protein